MSSNAHTKGFNDTTASILHNEAVWTHSFHYSLNPGTMSPPFSAIVFNYSIKKKKTSLALNPGAWKPTVYKVLLLSVTCSLLGTPSTRSCPLFPDSLVNSGSRPAEDKHCSLEASKARAYQDGSALRRGKSELHRREFGGSSSWQKGQRADSPQLVAVTRTSRRQVFWFQVSGGPILDHIYKKKNLPKEWSAVIPTTLKCL